MEDLDIDGGIVGSSLRSVPCEAEAADAPDALEAVLILEELRLALLRLRLLFFLYLVSPPLWR